MNSHDAAAMVGHTCDGAEYQMMGGGTWKGHVWPGIVFVCWGLWWAWQAFARYHRGRADGSGYSSRAWWPGCWAMEPLLKNLGPPLGMLVELRLDHDRFLSLMCQDGHFSLPNLHNYQHAASYPAFMLSGLVDLLGTRMRLPPGTEQAFLALAFGVEGLLMASHTKHEPLDRSVHAHLAATMLTCAAFACAELAAPKSLLLTSARALACLTQGMWLIEIGQIMYREGSPWKADGAMGGVMLVPAAFAMLTLLGAAILLALFLALQAWYARHPPPHDRLPSIDLDESNFFSSELRRAEDSANEDSDSAHAEPQRAGQKRGQQIMSAFRVLLPGQERRDKGEHCV